MFLQAPPYYSLRSSLQGGGSCSSRKGIDWSGQWPEASTSLCWMCCHTFECKPLPMPLSYNAKLNHFVVTGIFCSWGCVKGYMRDYASTHMSRGHDQNALTLFHKRVTGKLDRIVGSPPRCLLAAFGGGMDIAEFRARGGGGIGYEVLPPRMVLHSQVVHEHKLGEARNARGVQSMADVVDLSSSGQNESMRMRRPKPANPKKASIFEKTLGLITSSPV